LEDGNLNFCIQFLNSAQDLEAAIFAKQRKKGCQPENERLYLGLQAHVKRAAVFLRRRLYQRHCYCVNEERRKWRKRVNEIRRQCRFKGMNKRIEKLLLEEQENNLLAKKS
jgi:hypothetical protein